MINVEHVVVINRPIEEVFGFIANSENTHLWAGDVKESKLTSEGPVGVGSTHTVVIEFLGIFSTKTFMTTVLMIVLINP